MNKITILASFLFATVFITSCNKKSDDPQPVTQNVTPAEPVTQQLYPSPTVYVGLTIEVLPISSVQARLEGLSGVAVFARQNGSNYEGTTDATGVITFSNLTEGTVNIFVKKEGFLSVNTTTTLKYSGTPAVIGTNGNATTGTVTVNNQQRSSASLSIKLPKLGSSVEGILRADADGSGPGTVGLVPSGTINLVLDNSNFSPNVFTTTVNNGSFVFTNLPEGVAYTLQTADISATEPATATLPSFKTNLQFPTTDRTTALNNDKQYVGIITLK